MDFDQIFERLIGHEGKYNNDPDDPGGETKWGISKRSYPQLNIKALTREQARTIYFDDFWTPLNAGQLYDGVAFQLFDFAVNSGIQTAIRYFQRALNVADDGHFGPFSRKAAQDMSESDQIMRLCAERLDYMRRLRKWKKYGSGWAGRIANNLRYGSIDS